MDSFFSAHNPPPMPALPIRSSIATNPTNPTPTPTLLLTPQEPIRSSNSDYQWLPTFTPQEPHRSMFSSEFHNHNHNLNLSGESSNGNNSSNTNFYSDSEQLENELVSAPENTISPAPMAVAAPWQRPKEFERVTDLGSDEIRRFYPLVRRTKILYNSLLVMKSAEHERRSDFKASSWMKKAGLWMDWRKKILGALFGIFVG